MPDNQRIYQSVIRITGQVSPTMLADLKKMGAQVRQVATEAKKVGPVSKASFEMMAAGSRLAEGAVTSLKAAMLELVAPLIAVTSLVKGVGWSMDEVKEGEEKVKSLREQMELLRSEIESTDLVAKHGYDPEKLVGKFLATTKQMAQEQGNLFGSGFY